jgi:hypothetical protein
VRQHLAAVQPADLARRLLDDRVPERDLTVARQGRLAVVPDAEYRCAVQPEIPIHHRRVEPRGT